MDPVDPNAAGYDPNEPDCTNGDFFCRLCLSSQNSDTMWSQHIAGKRHIKLCLSSQNSDTMWSQHIAGKRHIKNAQKFPNGLPTRERDNMHEEDSYERPPMRERFDDGYDLHDDYPMPKYKDDYYGEDPYLKRPLVDYTPAVKPNIVIDYGHSKKLEEVLPTAAIDKSSVPTPIPSVSRPLPASSPVDFRDVLEQLLPKSAIETHQPEVKDDFFEKINQREMAKELAKELAKKSMSLDSLKPAVSTSDKKDSDNKTGSARDGYDKYDKRKPDILDIIYENSDKKLRLDNERDFEKRSPSYENNEKRRSRLDDERDFEKRSSSYGNNEKKRSRHDDERDFEKRSSSRENNEKRRSRPDDDRNFDKRSSSRENNEKRRSRHDDEKDYAKRKSYESNDKKRSRHDDEKDSEKRSSSYKNNDKKKPRHDDDKDSEKKSSLSKKSSEKPKSALDDFDPDELTPDILDTLLSANLKYKKTDTSDEICNKKHCVKNIVDLDDPKVIAEKLESLSTMEFLNIIHKKLISIDLKTPEELKKLLAVIAEAQATVCKKLPPELQELVKAKLSGKDSQSPAQNPVVSQTPSITSATILSNLISQNPVVSQTSSITSATILSNLISKNSIASVPSLSQATVSENPVPKPVILPTPNIPVSLNQSSVSTVSSAARPQNQIPVSYPSSVTATIPTMTPLRITAPPPPPPLINVASLNRAASMGTNSVQNYYDMIFSMVQNRPLVAAPTVPNMFANQQLPAASRFSFPPPPPPPLPPSQQARPQIVTKEILDAVAKLKNQSQQSKQESSSVSDKSQPQTREEILAALKNLDLLQEEYKRRKAQKSASENKNSTSEKAKSSPYSKR